VTSRYRRFNAKQRLSGIGLTRQFLFIWQTSWYTVDSLPFFLKAFKAVMESTFLAEETIKPVLSYLAAHLHDGKLRAIQFGVILNLSVKPRESLLQRQFCPGLTTMALMKRRSSFSESLSHFCLSPLTAILVSPLLFP
jgi:hypothetical protein